METTVGGGIVVGEKRLEEKFCGFGYAPLLYGKMIRTDEGTLQPAVSHIPNLGGGAASMPARGVPFTATQWQELHRQALIYKHFVSSVPLPPYLLMGGGGGGGGGGLDPEAGRCKRTDGKKWRCSRDAAPEQKYCERHMHRGRPRSRKPVEQKPSKSPEKSSVHSGFFPIDGLKPMFQSMESVKKPRYIDWMKGEETEVFGSSNQWELPNLNIGTSSDDNNNNNTHSVLQPYDDQLNLYVNEQSRFFPFIDAWSSEAPASPMIKHDNGKLPLSTLSLSMYGGTIEESSDQIEMANNKAQAMNWMRPVSPPGGPLAEALQSSTATSPNNALASSSSSASGVLQRALVSLSDSSAGSSPTFAGACRSEIALQWLKQSK